jgi:hypothetical protein
MPLLMILLALFSAQADAATFKRGDSAFTRSQKRSFYYDIEITFDHTPASLTHLHNSGLAVAPLNKHKKQLIINTLQQALGRYPQAVLSNHIDRVIVFDRIVAAGPNGRINPHTMIAGFVTDNARHIHLALPYFSLRNHDKMVAQTFHHEFTHVLMNTYPQYFDERTWQALNPPGFAYGKLSSNNYQKTLFGEGFANAYGQTSLAEDVATTAELLLGVTNAGNIAARYPRIRAKMGMLKAFFLKVDPQLSSALYY